ncbi:hypothetical protein ANCDUO_20927 [Ancylostoma duodenale]|uniref:Uncharacterized protein n=1 Tax=Ancylostoma duodenale TaxID=51022 RepID=A0A0C2FQQ2_9BILA|nr:hypothetical protein ANCDUO_20927 [Ancylostoma duodenale]
MFALNHHGLYKLRYDYEPVRHCTPAEPDCDSMYYWCDTKAWRCRSKQDFPPLTGVSTGVSLSNQKPHDVNLTQQRTDLAR